MATLDQAIEQMLSNGMPPFQDGGPRINSDRIIRYGKGKKAWYRLYEFTARNGRSYITGAYGIWGALDKTKIETDWTGIDEIERARLQKQQDELAKREQERREERARFAARRARAQYLKAAPEGKSPYLDRKMVEWEKGLKLEPDGTLLVPMMRYDEEKPRLVGLQKIAPDGSKRFNKGMAKEGAARCLGAKPKDGDLVLIAEGIATGLSIRMALGRRLAVFVAFDCYNLAPVAKMLRARYPKSAFVFCADDDFQTDGNPGMTRASAAATAVGNSKVIAPIFANRGENKWTDFNDLHVAEGLAIISKQLDAFIGSTPDSKKSEPAGRFVDWKKFFKRFVLIYPTETAWDDDLEKIVKVSAMRLHFGKGVIDYWLGSDDRRTVNEQNVVFDPSCTCDPATTVNIFRGLKLKPSTQGSCAGFLELLQFLCGEEGQEQAPVTDWLLKWIAYPLVHPGAKMRTAVVMFGPEGTGKNLLWGAVKDIYGDYGTFITQFQLQSQFNDWASRKQFVIANEVVTRMELRHLVGYLKNLVTEERIPVETKNMPVRIEDNHMQLVFLSNELRPLHIAPGDRRYMVVKTPAHRDASYYEKVAKELAAGGVARLYDYLLHEVDLTDFSEHSKPIETGAKRDLVELGLSSTQLFWQGHHEGMIPVPYGPCLSQDLYRVYLAWCVRNGEKMPMSENNFSHQFMSMNGVIRKRVRIADPDKPMEESLPPDRRRQRKVFIMGDVRPDDQDESSWLKKKVGEFRDAAKDYLGQRSFGSTSDHEEAR